MVGLAPTPQGSPARRAPASTGGMTLTPTAPETDRPGVERSNESLVSFATSPGTFGWRYDYRDVRPVPSPAWISSGAEIAVQLRGRWHHRALWGGVQTASPGECLFLSPGEPYSYVRSLESEPGLQVGFLLVSEQHARLRGAQGELRWNTGRASEPKVVELARYVLREVERDCAPDSTQIEDALAEVIARGCHVRPTDGIVEARHELERHFAAPLYMRHFAEVAGVGEATFTRHFAARFGQTPAHYRLTLRINAVARQLTMDHDARARDVARSMGFEDESFFFRTFRALVGQTPQRYAERARAAARGRTGDRMGMERSRGETSTRTAPRRAG